MGSAPFIRAARAEDASDLTRLRTAVWPETPKDHVCEVAEYFANLPARSVCLVAASAEGRVVGFAEVGVRDYAEDCLTSPVGFLEGIYVDTAWRTGGIGRALVEAGESWARARGCTEMASDRSLENEASGAFHVAIGYDEVQRIVCYRKDL
jgi:aminoglycoside 6'-N-acetyltransferase I